MTSRITSQTRGSGGFTLLEMLIVLALMSITGLLAWSGLTAVSRGAAHIELPLNRTLRLTRAMTQLKLDAAAIATPNEIGFDPLAITAGRLMLVRRLDSEATGAAFQVVSYQLVAQALWRSASPPLQDSAGLRSAWRTLEQQDPSKTGMPMASMSALHPPAQTVVANIALAHAVQRIDWKIWLPMTGWTSDNHLLERADALVMHPGSIYSHRTDLLPAALSLQLFTTDASVPLRRDMLLGH